MAAFNNANSTTTFYKLRAKTSETDPTAFFGKQTKTGTTWATTETFNSFSGNLIDIEAGTYEHEGETKHKCKLTFKDSDGTRNVIESNFNNLLYSALNSLASTNPEFVELTLSLGKAKIVNGKEGKRYPAIWVKNNGTQAEWKYKYEDQPKPEEVKVGTKTVKDDTKVVEFWTKVINTEIKPKLKTEEKTAKKPEVSEVMDAPSDSLPF